MFYLQFLRLYNFWIKTVKFLDITFKIKNNNIGSINKYVGFNRDEMRQFEIILLNRFLIKKIQVENFLHLHVVNFQIITNLRI